MNTRLLELLAGIGVLIATVLVSIAASTIASHTFPGLVVPVMLLTWFYFGRAYNTLVGLQLLWFSRLISKFRKHNAG